MAALSTPDYTMKYALQFALFRIQNTRPGVEQYWCKRPHSEFQNSKIPQFMVDPPGRP